MIKKQIKIFKKVMPLLIIIIILLLSFVIFKCMSSFYHNEKEINEQTSPILSEKDLQTVDLELKYEDCMNSSDFTSKSTEQQILDLKNVFQKDSKAFSFCYTDLTTDNSFCENPNGYLFAASVTKAPVNIYIYELASEGATSLDTKLTFTSSHKRDGTGILKNKPLNTKYTIRELVEYSTRYSDNSAHSMLVSKYGKENIKKFWNDLGSKTTFMDNTLFSKLSSRDGNIYMKELYRFYLESEYGVELMGYFKNVSFKLINVGNLEIAHKYGWTNNYLHDSAIIFDKRPFALTIMSTKGDSDYKTFFTNISNKVYEIHNSYWSEKETYCKGTLN